MSENLRTINQDKWLVQTGPDAGRLTMEAAPEIATVMNEAYESNKLDHRYSTNQLAANNGFHAAVEGETMERVFQNPEDDRDPLTKRKFAHKVFEHMLESQSQLAKQSEWERRRER